TTNAKPNLPKTLPNAGPDVITLLDATGSDGTPYRVMVESLDQAGGDFLVVAVPLSDVQSTLSGLLSLEGLIGSAVLLASAAPPQPAEGRGRIGPPPHRGRSDPDGRAGGRPPAARPSRPGPPPGPATGRPSRHPSRRQRRRGRHRSRPPVDSGGTRPGRGLRRRPPAPAGGRQPGPQRGRAHPAGDARRGQARPGKRARAAHGHRPWTWPFRGRAAAGFRALLPRRSRPQSRPRRLGARSLHRGCRRGRPRRHGRGPAYRRWRRYFPRRAAAGRVLN